MTELPKNIGRYEVLAEIGRGGMGVVYQARDPNIGRMVALKVIHLTFDADAALAAEMKERFKREAEAAGVLQHPNIVSVYDAGEEEGVSYIALEYVEGVTLESLMTPGELMPIGKVCSILSQAARGMAFAHAKGIVHRDLKPANIIVASTGDAKIMDFGIARVIGSELTQKGMVLGSPSYMSPEQITGQAVDHKSDIFSLGVILYQLLTGEKPFPGENPTSIGYRIVQTEHLEPTQVNPVISPAFNQIVARALAKRPENRYDSADQLARDLECVAEGRPVECAVNVYNAVTRPIKAVELKGPVKDGAAAFRHRKLLLGLAAGALVLAAAIVLYFVWRDPYAGVRELIEQGRHEEAVAALLKERAERPRDARASYLIGREYVELNDFEKSVEAYGQALQLKPDYRNDEALQKDLVQALALPEEGAEAAVKLIAASVGEPIAPRLEEALNNPEYNTHWNAARALTDMGRKVDKLPLFVLDYKYNPDCAIRSLAEKSVRETGDAKASAEIEAVKKESTLPSCEEKAPDSDDSSSNKINKLLQPKKGSSGKDGKGTWLDKLKDKLKNPQ